MISKTYVRYNQGTTQSRHKGGTQQATQVRASLPADLPGRMVTTGAKGGFVQEG